MVDISKRKHGGTTPQPQIVAGYLKKICQIKEEFKQARTLPNAFEWQGEKQYNVKNGYEQLGVKERVPGAKIIWARLNIPSHAFIT